MVDNTRLTPTIWVPLAQVRISERRRRSISQATVERYRQWLELGREAPPVRLARQGDVYVVRDGRHRVAAALAAGHAVVNAELRRIGGWLERRFAVARAIPTGCGNTWEEALTACRRLRLLTPVAQRTERCPATAEAAGSSPAGRVRGRSSVGRAPERHFGEARSNRAVRFRRPVV